MYRIYWSRDREVWCLNPFAIQRQLEDDERHAQEQVERPWCGWCCGPAPLGERLQRLSEATKWKRQLTSDRPDAIVDPPPPQPPVMFLPSEPTTFRDLLKPGWESHYKFPPLEPWQRPWASPPQPPKPWTTPRITLP